LNLGLSYLCHLFQIPLFLNTIGTVLAGALCGSIPALVVALITNVAFVAIDSLDAYYASLTIAMGILVFLFSRLGILKKWWGLLITYVSFVLIDGIFVTLLAFFINGGTFGNVLSASFARWWVNQGVAPFWALFFADSLIGIVDKAIVVPVLGLFLRFLPNSLVKALPLGKIYAKGQPYAPGLFKKAIFHSLKARLVVINLLTDIAIGLAFSGAFYFIDKDICYNDYEKDGATYSQAVGDIVDGSQVETYLAAPDNPNADYEETNKKLENIFDSSQGQIDSIYVLKFDSSGGKVVFVIDPGRDVSLGRSLSLDEDLKPYEEEILSGQKIPPFYSDGGKNYKVYAPIASGGNTVAYAVVDIDMEKAATDVNVALTEAIDITVIILFFGAAIADYTSDNRITGPIKILDQQMSDFKEIGPDKWLDSASWTNRIEIRTGDELEDLGKRLNESEETIASSYAALEIQDREIQKLQESVVSAFAEMVESRDPLTGDHVKRASFYVGAIAEELVKEKAFFETLTAEYIKRLVIAAPLHDIGKIVIPDAILNKPGKLTPEEFEIMKTHTTVGKKIIEKAMQGASNRTYLSIAGEIAYTHHERWDGKGYPQGFSQENIPLSGRIMAVADVFDALVSKRPYKEPYSFEEAISIIEEESGTHFDPQVAKAFLSIQGKIRDYLKANDRKT